MWRTARVRGYRRTGSGTGQWSVFEDHSALVRTTPAARERTLRELAGLGADTLRIEGEVERARAGAAGTPPSELRSRRPRGLPRLRAIRRPRAQSRLEGFPDPDHARPRGAPVGHRGRTGKSPERANLRPLPAEFAKFAGAVAKRYSGSYRGLPKVQWFSIGTSPTTCSS